MTPLFTTVVTPAASRQLVTLDDLREQLRVRPGDVANDPWYNKVIDRASRAAERYCDRIFVQQEYLDTFATNATGGTSEPLILGQSPVDPASLGITLDGVLIDSGEYLLDPTVGHLFRVGTYWTNESGLTVAYTGGFAEIPPDVQQAVLDLCTAENSGRGRDPMLRATESPGLGRQEFWVGGIPGSSTLPPDIASLLDPYVRGIVG
jgi:hypothetical protein